MIPTSQIQASDNHAPRYQQLKVRQGSGHLKTGPYLKLHDNHAPRFKDQ